MHRKRSSNSLEQGLVTQQQQTIHPTYSLNIQHSFSGLPKINGSGMCTSRLPFASLIAFLCCLFGVLLFSTMMLWAFNASIEQIRRALRISNLPWLDKVQLLFIISTLVVVVVSLALLCIGVLSTGPTRESVFRKKDAQSGGRLSCIGAVILSSALHFLWTIIATLTAILTFAHSVLFALCSIVGDSSNPNQCLDLSVFGPLTNGQASASLKFCEGQLQEFCAFTNTVVVWYFIGFTGALIVCIGFLQFIGTNTANYARIQSEAKYNELQHIVYAETMGVPMNHFMGRDTLSNDHFMDCSPAQRKQRFGGQRPKSKAEKVRERQNRLITFNHPDLLEELRKRKTPVDNEESEATSGETVGRKKKRSLAVEDQIDEVFKNILSGGGGDDSEDKSGSEWPEESSESFLPADEGEDESPEEFSSKLKDHSEEFQSAKTVLEKEEHVRRKKLSKKKRDALKDFEQKSEKIVQKVGDGIYKVDMSGAQFEVVALESVMAGDELAQSSHVKKHVQFSFREQLLRVSTAKNRSNRFRFGADKRASVFLKKS